MKTDSEILDWLEANVVYMEHGDKADMSKYWPQSHTDPEPEEGCVDLSLREYVERMMG
jgi:hypothetical protein